MRKVWVTIITYNNIPVLNKNLEHLFSSDLVTSGKYDWYIEIINNHHNFQLQPEFADRVTVHHQTLRPEWSYTGFFTRDCNSALMRGFKNLKAPLNDQLIILQDDVFVKPDFMARLVDGHDGGLDFVMSGIGDALNSFLPQAVRKIGLYDERFQTGFHEGDYILRAIQKLGGRCSIGDVAHGRIWNSQFGDRFYASDNGTANVNSATRTSRAESDLVICPGFTDDQIANVGKRHGTTWHEPLWKLKWGAEHRFYNWSDDFKHNVIPTLKQRLRNYILYPHFEKEIEGIYTETYHEHIPELNAVVDRPLYVDIIYNGHGSRHEW